LGQGLHPGEQRRGKAGAAVLVLAVGPGRRVGVGAGVERLAYIDGDLSDGTILPLYRLRYNGSASIWGFAIYLASRDGYEDNILPSGLPAGSPEEALDCVCGLYLNDPTGWSLPPTN
jgi:hypothetical protein